MTKIKYLFAGLIVAAVVAAPVAANATASQGGGHTPVTVCHNGSTLTVDDNALKAHLAHGDTEGPCQESTQTGSETPTETTSPTTPTTAHPSAPTTTTPTTAPPTDTTATPQPESPAEPSLPTEPVATSPTSAAPQPSAGTTPTTSPKYILAVWRNEAGAPKFPQYLVASYETDSTNVKVLDQYAQLCGTFYQSDLYANDARTKALIAKGVLNGGDESWPDNGTQRYNTLTTQPCPTAEPTAPPTTTPEVTPSPSTPLPSDSPTLPSQPSDSPSPTTPVTVTSASPSTTKSVDVVTPVTEQKVTGTTTAPATEKRATNSLAMTGSETVKQWSIIGALLLFVGVFAVLDARKMRKIAQKIK